MPFLPLLTILLFLLPSTLAWGSLGHRTVAYLASLHFTPHSHHLVNTLLHGQDISEAALFPDKIAHLPQFAFTRQWHYIDARDDPPQRCGINMTRDCVASEGGCVVSAIANHTARVMDERLPWWMRGQSLRFVLHFIGDIHQPLHTEMEDRGGNGIEVVFDGKHTNLHSVWDSGVVNKYVLPDGKSGVEDEIDAAWLWAQKLYFEDVEDGKDRLDNECVRLGDAVGCALRWATEANYWVCEYVLKDDIEGLQGKDLGGQYYEGAVPIVNTMVKKAGRRLAAWVNAMAENIELEVQEL